MSHVFLKKPIFISMLPYQGSTWLNMPSVNVLVKHEGICPYIHTTV